MPATDQPTRVLPTSVVGSYSVPEWLERLKTDFYQRRISSQYIDDIHEVAIKAALKDQERAGVDVVSDGELRRDNDVDYFLVRMPGIEIPHIAKTFYYDYYDAYVRHAIPVDDDQATLGLVDDLRFTLNYTDRPVKFSFTGPFSLARRYGTGQGLLRVTLHAAWRALIPANQLPDVGKRAKQLVSEDGQQRAAAADETVVEAVVMEEKILAEE